MNQYLIASLLILLIPSSASSPSLEKDYRQGYILPQATVWIPEKKEQTVEELIATLVSYQTEVTLTTAMRIAQCESSLNPSAKNPKSSAKGLYQFTDPTWKYIGASGTQYDAEENIKQFLKHYPRHPGWWECR